MLESLTQHDAVVSRRQIHRSVNRGVVSNLGELLQEYFVSLREANKSFFTLETFRRVTECDECDDAACHQGEGAEAEE